MWLYAFLGILFLGYGILIHGMKQYRLLSKYNKMTNEDKSRVDINSMAKLVGVVMYFDSALLLISAILVHMGIEVPFGLISVVLVVSLVFMTLFMQRYDGNLFDEHHKLKKGLIKKFAQKGALTMVSLILVACVLFYSTRPLVVEVSEDAVVIKGMYGTTIPLSEIEDIIWLEELPKVEVRTNGAAIGPYLKGHFKLADYGAAKLFVDKNNPNFILIKTKEEVVIFNMDSASLKVIYDQIHQK